MADLLGRGLRTGREAQALSPATTCCWSTSEALFSTSGRALARPVQRPLRRAALRSDQHVLRGRASDVPEGDKRRRGYSRATSGQTAPQVVIALVVTLDGLPLAYEVLPGNTVDMHDAADVPRQDRAAIRQGAARLGNGSRRADRGGCWPRCATADPPVRYLVGNAEGTAEPAGEAPARKSPGKTRARA